MVNLIISTLLVVLVYKTLVFLLSVFLKRNDVADVSWGISFVLIAIITLTHSIYPNPTLLLISTLITIWGFRLAFRIAVRNRKKKEDFRYVEMLKDSGKFFYLKSFLQVFLLQGLLAVLVSFPTLIAGTFGGSHNLGFLAFLGLALWIVGFFFEVVGDWQLDQFMKNPENKGKILNQGLWKYSRHPNYFGEIVMWWGIFLIVVAVPNGIWSIIGPLIISFLILFVSGIPLLEKKYRSNQAYKVYKRHTSTLIPLPPRK